MARMTFAAIAAVLLLACCAQQAAAAGRALKSAGRSLKTECAPLTNCPQNYLPIELVVGTTCSNYCQKPVFPSCPPGWARDALICGGTTGVTCPAIACASSNATVVSGPGGCAKAFSTISATSLSQATYNSVYKLLEIPTEQYCAGSSLPLAFQASQIATNHAKSVAQSLIYYSQYVCTCCRGNNYAYSGVAADVLGVAQASAQAAQNIVKYFTDCFGADSAAAAADAFALAEDTQLAVGSVYKDWVSSAATAGTCQYNLFQRQIVEKVAEATVCTFTKILARAAYSAADSTTVTTTPNQLTTETTTTSAGMTVFACSQSVAMSGYPNVHTCSFNFC